MRVGRRPQSRSALGRVDLILAEDLGEPGIGVVTRSSCFHGVGEFLEDPSQPFGPDLVDLLDATQRTADLLGEVALQ